MSTETALFTLPSGRVMRYAITASSSSSSSADGPTVILSNPLCAPLQSWDRVVPVLASKGFRVLRYDPPGHGGSSVAQDLSSTTFDSLADDVRHLLRHLGIPKLHAWIGVSMGAATGIVFAARHPSIISRLVACDTISCSPANAGTTDVFGPRVDAARQAGNMDATVEGSLERWFGRGWMEENPSETARMRQAMRETSIDGFETCCAALRSKSFDLRPLLEDAGRGVESALLLVGGKDANLSESMKELRQGIEDGIGKSSDPDASVDLKVIKGAGHVCYIDGFEQFQEISLINTLHDALPRIAGALRDLPERGGRGDQGHQPIAEPPPDPRSSAVAASSGCSLRQAFLGGRPAVVPDDREEGGVVLTRDPIRAAGDAEEQDPVPGERHGGPQRGRCTDRGAGVPSQCSAAGTDQRHGRVVVQTIRYVS
ncbi:hypothetical protein DL770_007895 [Monosporascus sp. CRB-9-2]|nr:hypothetical protein DL770_007895 [Monosporascus sp. CRB-9-2]